MKLIKKITDMTPQDKKMFLEATKQSMKREHGIEWADIERKIQDEIDATFDDDKFAKMDPDFAIDAAYARKYFEWDKKHEKPSLVDYILWSTWFVTKSEYVEF